LRFSFQILRKRFAARNLKCFDFYYFCVLSKPTSQQQIYFQNQRFTMEKLLITTRVNCPRAENVELSNYILKQLLHTGPEHVPHTKFEQLQHFILVLFDWLIRNLVLLSDMPGQLLECVSDAVHGVSTCLTVSLCWAQLFCPFHNKIPFLVVICKYCKWCMHPAPMSN